MPALPGWLAALRASLVGTGADDVRGKQATDDGDPAAEGPDNRGEP
jgi:hypothetical protein